MFSKSPPLKQRKSSFNKQQDIENSYYRRNSFKKNDNIKESSFHKSPEVTLRESQSHLPELSTSKSNMHKNYIKLEQITSPQPQNIHIS